MSEPPRVANRFWGLLTVGLATIPVAGMFTLSRIFFIRDLTLAFRSRFLFFRHAVLSGTWPLWDPYPANGQAAVNDALYQMFHLPSLPLRLLLPETIAYNTWIAFPVPVAALGMYLFLRRHVSAAAACFGGVAFAVAGPIVSTTNFPNMSWSVCAAPFVFWALEVLFARRSAGAVALVAATVACQALAGEPVTLAATLAIAAAYVVVVDRRWRDPRLVGLAAVAIGAGLLLAAIQYLPMMAASRGSMRGARTEIDFWAFHPLALIELVVPHFFGDHFHSQLRELTWMVALNSGRDPFYFSMYLGLPIVFLAFVAACSGRPRTIFWTATVLVCAVMSLGPHTPIYNISRTLIPPLREFRFPVKYLSLGALGVAALAANALQWFIDGTAPRRPVRILLVLSGIGAALTYVVIAWVLIAPRLPIHAAYDLAIWAHVPVPIQGAEFLLYRARPLLTSLLLKVIAGAFLLGVAASGRRERRLALAVFVAFAGIDLLWSNAGLNPTMELKQLQDPAWVHVIPPDAHQRVYVGGRLEGYVNVTDVDAPKYTAYLDGPSELEQRYIVITQFLMHTSGAHLRDPLSYDLPVLWPIEYARLVGMFKDASREQRLRFLSRVGVRWEILPTPPFPNATPLAQLVGAEQMHLYDVNPGARRVYVVPDAGMGPDVEWQIQGLFEPRFDPSKTVLITGQPPPPAGAAGPAVPASATFVEDGINRVVVRAGLPADGYLALLDSYDRNWRVDVDGAPAPLMRANGLFRAVHLTRGRHTVTFTFRPRLFYVGAAITAVTALALVLACVI